MKIEVKNTRNTVNYLDAVKILEKRADDVFLGKKKELLWILEHKLTYTGGTSTNDKDILDKKIKVIPTKRGGKITCHSPGQKVVYFVLNLNKRGKDIRKFIMRLENCILEILKDYGINAYTDAKNIGVWVGDKKNPEKVAAIGIKIKKWVAFHGFSLNLNNNLSHYNKIIPCGIKNKKVTNLKELGINNFKHTEKIIAKNFLNFFY